MVAKDDYRPNLAVVDEAFGPGSDLYVDVLQVQPNAGTGQIHDAYFDRRNELFQLLADIDGDNEQDSITESHRRSAERKLDAVVCGIRILGDPDLRLQYDDMRTERLKAYHRNSPKRKPSAQRYSSRTVEDSTAPDDEVHGDRRQPPSSSNASAESSEFEEPHRSNLNELETPVPLQSRVRAPYTSNSPQRSPQNPRVVSPEIPARRSQDKMKSARGSPQLQQPERTLSTSKRNPKVDESFDNEDFTAGSETILSEDGDEDETLYTYDDDVSVSESILRKTSQKPKGILDRIRMEAIGACDDTARSFAQVCNVFTLQEADIRAVMGRIDKASRQLHEGVVLPSVPVAASRSSRTRRSATESSSRKSAGASSGRRSSNKTGSRG